MKRMLITMAAILAVQAFAAPVSGAVARSHCYYLFVVDTSFSMRRFSKNTIATVSDLVRTGIQGQIMPGDVLDIWAFNEELHPNLYRPVFWEPRLNEALAKDAANFLDSLHCHNQTRMDRVIPTLIEAAKAHENLVAILISDGNDHIQGTPFDDILNSIYDRHYKELRSQKLPFVTTLAARRGALIAYTVNASGLDIAFNDLARQIAEAFPVQQLADVSQKPEPAKAVAQLAQPESEPQPATARASVELTIRKASSPPATTNLVQAVPEIEQPGQAPKPATIALAAPTIATPPVLEQTITPAPAPTLDPPDKKPEVTKPPQPVAPEIVKPDSAVEADVREAPALPKPIPTPESKPVQPKPVEPPPIAPEYSASPQIIEPPAKPPLIMPPAKPSTSAASALIEPDKPGRNPKAALGQTTGTISAPSDKQGHLFLIAAALCLLAGLGLSYWIIRRGRVLRSGSLITQSFDRNLQ